MLNCYRKRLERSNRPLLLDLLAYANGRAKQHMAKAGETVTIQKITGKDEVRLHLAELGFVVGETITVVNEISGNLILQVKEARIALDKTMAMRIMVA